MRDMQTVNSEMAAVQLSTAAGTEENTENNMDENSKLELDTEAVYKLWWIFDVLLTI